MFGLGKKLGNLFATAKKVENRDLMQAIVGGCLLVAAADGEIEQSEVSKMERLIRSNDNLTGFGNEISATIQKYTDMLEADFEVGKLKIEREIKDVANNATDSEEVFVNMLAIAKADGEIEPAELAVLTKVARMLSVRLSDYGLA